MENIKDIKEPLFSKMATSEKVMVVPHLGVDFDAIGSALGISVIASKVKKPSYIIIDDPIYKIDHGVQIIMDEVKNNYPIINREKALQVQNVEDLFVLTDVSKRGLIALKDAQIDKENVVIIDHHEPDHTTLESTCKYIDPKASSASELVAKLLVLYKIKIPTDIANYLLAGIYLDTNKLTKNVSACTMKIVAKLMEAGANLNIVTDLFAEDFKSDRRVQELVSKAYITTYSVATILADDSEEYTKEELAKAADYLLKYKVDASFAIGRIDENTVSISARSKDKINVGEIMKLLGGGGNSYSAAGKFEKYSTEEVGKELTKVIIPKYYR